MELWTIQISAWREAKRLDIPFLDTTVKSGDPVFAPSWDIVTKVKNGTMTQTAYTTIYHQMMRESYLANRSRWVEVCSMDRVAVACYCASGKFCHRHLLIDYFRNVCLRLGIPFEYMGEIAIVK